MVIYEVQGCTIEVADGCRTAKVTRIETGESHEFTSVEGGPTAQLQAQDWAMATAHFATGLSFPVEGSVFTIQPGEKLEPVGLDVDGQFKPINELSYSATDADEPTDLDEATDGQ